MEHLTMNICCQLSWELLKIGAAQSTSLEHQSAKTGMKELRLHVGPYGPENTLKTPVTPHLRDFIQL